MEFEVEASAMKVSFVKAPFGVGLRPMLKLSISEVAALSRMRRLITSGRVTETVESLELEVPFVAKTEIRLEIERIEIRETAVKIEVRTKIKFEVEEKREELGLLIPLK